MQIVVLKKERVVITACEHHFTAKAEADSVQSDGPLGEL